MAALFLMGCHSAFFGPLKYSVLPQYLKEHELVGGNGMIEMGTFLAILIGQIIGSLMTEGGPLLIVPAIAYRGVWLAVQPPHAGGTARRAGSQLSFNFIGDSVRLVGRPGALLTYAAPFWAFPGSG
jgi:hypothetical protein